MATRLSVEPHAAPVSLRVAAAGQRTPPVAARDLASRLQRIVRGEVRFDAGSRALYSTDASNYRQVPIGVVVPRDSEDVMNALALCRDYGAPVLGRGGGTSLAGQCCNTAVVFDFSKYMHRVLEIDPDARRARVQPGTALDSLRSALAPHRLTFGPDPATHQYCTLGGMIGNNSCGVHSVLAAFYGPGPTTGDNIESLEVVTYDGARMRVGATSDAEFDAIVRRGGRQAEIYQQLRAFRDRYADLIRREFPDLPRRVSGYNLPALLPENAFHIARALVGSESTLAITVEATAELLPVLPHRVLVVLGYPSVYEAADHVSDVLAHRPVGLEGMDDLLVRDLEQLGVERERLDLLPDGAGWLLVDVSMAVGERVLLPAVRAATRDTLIIADGFSCREQIAQATDGRALHLADVLQMAINEGPRGPAGDRPERSYVPSYEREVTLSGPTAAALAGAVITAGALLARATRIDR